MNMKDLLIALVVLVLLCLLGPVVVGILSALVAVAPYPVSYTHLTLPTNSLV